MLLLRWCLFEIHKEKQAGLQFNGLDYLSRVLAPLRIRWTIPLVNETGEFRLCIVKTERYR
jgi:hypothetical protein